MSEINTWTSLETVSDAIKSCTKCPLSRTRKNTVPGAGCSNPTILFVGEGPGFNEDEEGLPFVGRAGRLLEKLLDFVPLKREDVYITNIVKCRPPENRDPLPNEIAACRPFLETQIQLLKPRVIATLGRHSLTQFLPNARISDSHGKVFRWRDSIVYPLYHPAAGLRSNKLRSILEEDFSNLPHAVVECLKLPSQIPEFDSGPIQLDIVQDEQNLDDNKNNRDSSQLSLF